MRKDHAPQNLSTLCKFALSLLRQDKQYQSEACEAAEKTPTDFPTIAPHC
jgi:hypothetical protein